MITALITLASLYVVGAFAWALRWTFERSVYPPEYDLLPDNKPKRLRASWMLLNTPAWPVLTVNLLRDAYARTRADARGPGREGGHTMTADWVVPPIQVCGPGLEEFGDNSSLRDRIAEAINGGPLPESGCDWEADMYQKQADAVIAALGLREERRPGFTTTLNDSVWTRPDKRRWVTEWEEA